MLPLLLLLLLLPPITLLQLKVLLLTLQVFLGVHMAGVLVNEANRHLRVSFRWKTRRRRRQRRRRSIANKRRHLQAHLRANDKWLLLLFAQGMAQGLAQGLVLGHTVPTQVLVSLQQKVLDLLVLLDLVRDGGVRGGVVPRHVLRWRHTHGSARAHARARARAQC